MRVIAGAFRGRRLVAPRGRETRPTSDRVRESLCMVLEPWTDRRVVDLYAGAGGLGIEALSRGAAFVDFVESSRAALEALEHNVAALGVAERARVWRLSLPAGLRSLRAALAAAHVVLLDPPYGGSDARRTLEALAEPGVLGAGTRLALEHHAKDDVGGAFGSIERVSERAYGETHITFFEVRGSSGPAAGGTET